MSPGIPTSTTHNVAAGATAFGAAAFGATVAGAAGVGATAAGVGVVGGCIQPTDQVEQAGLASVLEANG